MEEAGRVTESGAVGLSDQAWSEARRRAEVIGPLGEMPQTPDDIVGEAAEKLGLSKRMVYYLLRRWRQSGGSVVSLAPGRRGVRRGKSLLPQEVETVISVAITEVYLTRQRPTVTRLLEAIESRCRDVGLRPPSLGTVQARVRRIDARQRLQKREGRDKARMLSPITGRFPEPDRILDVVQIDHTPVDLIVVDGVHRQPIGRPWLTLAIDVFSRCIVGMCLTLEAPSATSVGLCLAHMVTDKRPWLERLGVQAEWPMSGKPKLVHVDNGSDFHSEALSRGCAVHAINIDYRPPGQPHFGGTIERVIGTFMQMVHDLPGTTFSNIQQKGDYQSETNAGLTLAELERWLVLAIAGKYHLDVHSSLGEPPIRRWSRSVEQSGEPFRVRDPKAFLIDFLPIERRQLRRDGFVLDHIGYMSNGLKPWIEQGNHSARFIIRRDPRDLSRIWVLSPEGGHYVEVPYRTMAHPAITLWEHRAAVAKVREEGRQAVDERAVFRAIGAMRRISEQAVASKKSARRASARRGHLARGARARPPAPQAVPPAIMSHDEVSGEASSFEVEEW
jgi:putative transposase